MTKKELLELAAYLRESAQRAETTTQRLEELGEALKLEQQANQMTADE